MGAGDKRIPDRQCICCRQMKSKNDLVRIVRLDSVISLDPTGKMNGRGAYVCRKKECIQALVSKRALDRSFRMHVSDEVYNSIIKEYLSEE